MQLTLFPLKKQFYADLASYKLPKQAEIIEFQNGLYQGDLFDYKRQGKGIFLWDNGQVYIGK